MERVLGNKVIFLNLVIYSLSILTSCQFTNEPNRGISRGVFQNRGQTFPLLPSPSPFHFFFCSRSNFRAITRLETLATQARHVVQWRQRSKWAKKKRWCTCKVVVLPILTCYFFAALVNVSAVDISLISSLMTVYKWWEEPGDEPVITCYGNFVTASIFLLCV